MLIHVYPIDDLKDHFLEGEACWCKPIEDEGCIIHNSMDGRELYETGERKFN